MNNQFCSVRLSTYGSQRLSFETRQSGLYVNDVPLLPADVAGHEPNPLIANQVKTDTKDEEYSANLRLSYVASVLPAIPSPHNDEISLIPVELTILKMNEIPVKVDTIVVKMIKTPKDGYVIVRVEQIPFEETPGAEVCAGTRSWSMCRIKAIALDALRRVMQATKEKADKVHSWVKEKTSGCGKHRGFFMRPGSHDGKKHNRPQHEDKHHRPHHHAGRPSHHHKSKHHGFHGRFHKASRMIRRTLRFFVVPALLGVIGGLTASAIGMLVGQAIVYLWFRMYRNGERGPLRIYEREIAVIEEEQTRLLDEKNSALPTYEDVPAYEQRLSRDVEADAADQDNEKQ